MDFWHGFAVITVVHLLAAASPGPDFAYVTRQSLVHGRKAGLLASAGIALGLSIHIVYSAAGLAAVIAHSAHWMTAIKLAGGCYLLYLGIRGLRSGRARRAGRDAGARLAGFAIAPDRRRLPLQRVQSQGAYLLPRAVHRGAVAGLPLPTLLVYGAWIMLLQWAWFSLVATLFAHHAVRDRLFAARHWIDRRLRRRHGGARCACSGDCARLSAIERLAASGQPD
jgi:threonine/homoserine/homoserine lactone efflux protein